MVMHMYIFVRRDFKKRNNYDTIPWQTRYPMEHCNNADRQHLSPDVICHEVPVRRSAKQWQPMIQAIRISHGWVQISMTGSPDER